MLSASACAARAPRPRLGRGTTESTNASCTSALGLLSVWGWTRVRIHMAFARSARGLPNSARTWTLRDRVWVVSCCCGSGRPVGGDFVASRFEELDQNSPPTLKSDPALEPEERSTSSLERPCSGDVANPAPLRTFGCPLSVRRRTPKMHPTPTAVGPRVPRRTAVRAHGDACHAVRPCAEVTRRYSRTLFLGASMGGFGALRHGSRLADMVVAFGPQTVLSEAGDPPPTPPRAQPREGRRAPTKLARACARSVGGEHRGGNTWRMVWGRGVSGGADFWSRCAEDSSPNWPVKSALRVWSTWRSSDPTHQLWPRHVQI